MHSYWDRFYSTCIVPGSPCWRGLWRQHRRPAQRTSFCPWRSRRLSWRPWWPAGGPPGSLSQCPGTHQSRGWIPGRNLDKSLKSFPPCYSQSPLLTDFSPDFLFVYIFSFWFYIIFWWILTCTGNALLYTDGLSVYSHNWSSYRTWCLTIALPYIL